MEKLIKIFAYLLLFSLPIGLINCGGNDPSKEVEIVLFPEQPLVSKSDFSINVPGSIEDVIISGPWFAFTYTIQNGAEAPLVIQDFELEVRRSGVFTVTTYTPNFGLFDQDRNRITVDPIQPGETYEEANQWPIDSLPEENNGNNSSGAASNFTYRCRITFFGYFEREDDPATENIDETGQPGARFIKTLTFTTR